MKSTLFYPGVFSPFSLQDADIVAKASVNGYHKVIVAIETEDKPSLFSMSDKIQMVKDTISWYDKVHKTQVSSSVEVISYYGLPIYEAIKHGADTFIVPVKDENEKINDVRLKLSRQIGRSLLSRPVKYCKVVVSHSREYINEAIRLLFSGKEYIMLLRYVAPPAHNVLMKYLLKYDYENCCRSSRISWDKFTAKMSERTYHNLSHIAYMLNKYRLYPQDTQDPNWFFDDQNLKAAIFFHDYVLDDEEKSFEASQLSESVRGLFMATKHLGNTPADLNKLEQLIHDLDLAILTDRTMYDTYRLGVRFEYPDMSDLEYIPKRLQVLKKLKQEITETKIFSRSEIDNAIKNIDGEIAYYCSRPSK